MVRFVVGVYALISACAVIIVIAAFTNVFGLGTKTVFAPIGTGHSMKSSNTTTPWGREE